MYLPRKGIDSCGVNSFTIRGNGNSSYRRNFKRIFSHKVFFKNSYPINNRNSPVSYSDRMRKLRDLINSNPASMSYVVLHKYPHLFE